MGALDGLRALAVAGVVAFHAGHLRGGFLGVDLFFALSGYLITSLLLRDADTDGVSLSAFWTRRARRLLPAVFALLLVVSFWAWQWGTPAELDGVRRSGPWALAYVANWHFVADANGYWASFQQPGMFDHLWSLAIEEQFYLAWPLAILAVSRWSTRTHLGTLVLAIVGAATSLVLMSARYGGGDPTRVYMGTDTRASSLLLGAALATAPATKLARALAVRRPGLVDAGLLVAVAAVGVSWFLVDGAASPVLYGGGLFAHSALCAAIVALLAFRRTGWVAVVLGVAPLQWLGRLSYSLYLWHWPVFVVLSPERTGIDGPVLTGLRVSVAVGFALLSLLLVEKPIRFRVAWVRDRRRFVPAVAASVALVAGVLVLLPRPATDIATFDAASIVVEPPTTPPATTEPPTTPSATTPPATTEPRERRRIESVLWLGDSVAYDLAPAIDASLTASGVRFVSRAFGGFGLAIPASSSSFLAELPATLDRLVPDVVVLHPSRWDLEQPIESQRLALTRFHRAVRDSGAAVVYVSAPPTALESDAGMDRLVALTAQLAADDPEHSWFLSATVVWGPGGTLDLDADGTPERKRDLVHVCPSGAARFALWLTDQLAARFDGLSPQPATEWAAGAWVSEGRYDQPVGACAPLG